jgi:hypothetical protein
MVESDKEQVLQVLEDFSALLQYQIALACADAEDGSPALTSPKAARALVSRQQWSLGYVFGFHDGMLQKMGVNEQTDSLAIMTIGYNKVFGESYGTQTLGKCLWLQSDPEFMRGVLVGGQEAASYLHDPDKRPMGLFDYLLGEGERKAKARPR